MKSAYQASKRAEAIAKAAVNNLEPRMLALPTPNEVAPQGGTLGELVDAAMRDPDHALVVGVNHIAGTDRNPTDLDGTIDRAETERTVVDAGPATVGGERG